jgi:hypothetical protein
VNFCLPLLLAAYIYNWAGAHKDQTPREALAAMDAHFVDGTCLGIHEPYVKQFADGTVSVRMDDPLADLVLLDHLGPTDATALHSQGNSHFRLAATTLGRRIDVMISSYWRTAREGGAWPLHDVIDGNKPIWPRWLWAPASRGVRCIHSNQHT